jgi:hypothetical protein
VGYGSARTSSLNRSIDVTEPVLDTDIAGTSWMGKALGKIKIWSELGVCRSAVRWTGQDLIAGRGEVEAAAVGRYVLRMNFPAPAPGLPVPVVATQTSDRHLLLRRRDSGGRNTGSTKPRT